MVEPRDDLNDDIVRVQPIVGEASSLREPSTVAESRAPSSARLPEIPGYQIGGLLGQGGMGVVYRAMQTSLRRPVALKLVAAVARNAARFRAEAEAVARLQHPNIVQIFEVGEHDGFPFLSLELVSGGTLNDRAMIGPFEPREAAKTVETLARAVAYVHAQGIVHRDLKPANVLIAADGTLKISDFGLAKVVGDDSGQTRDGDVIGTPSYMAPEQASGKASGVGPAADVYALGAILYRLLTGKPPLQGANAIETVRLVVHEEPTPPSRIRRGLPGDLEAICLKCLEKSPFQRYSTAADLADDLARFLTGEPTRARPIGPASRVVRWTKRRPALAGLLGVAALAVTTLAASGWWFSGRLQHAVADLERESSGRLQQLVRFSIDAGTRAAENDDPLGALPWYAEALRLGGDDPLLRQRIAAQLDRLPRLARVWSLDGPVRHASFSPDGKFLAVSCGDGGARVWSVDTGEPRFLPLNHEHYVSHVAFSADGKRLATACYDGSARVWDAETGRPLTSPLRHAAPVHTVAFTPDGERLLACGGAWTGATLTGDTRMWEIATGQPLTKFLPAVSTLHGALSPDGKLAAITTVHGQGFVHDTVTGKLVMKRPVLAAGPRPSQFVRYGGFSPDGKRVLLPFGFAEVWDTATWTRLVADPKDTTNSIPTWQCMNAAMSPDGKIIAIGGRETPVRLFGLGFDRSTTRPLPHAAEAYHMVFSPDSRQLATVSLDTAVTVWHVPTGRRLAAPLKHNSLVHHAAFSPDGRYLVVTTEDGLVRLWDLWPLWPPGRRLRAEPMMLTQFDRSLRTGAVGVFPPETRLWDAMSDTTYPSIPLFPGNFKRPFNKDGSRFALADPKQRAVLWNVPDGRAVFEPIPLDRYPLDLAVSDDGQKMAVVGSNLIKKDLERPQSPYSLTLIDADAGKTIAAPFPLDAFTHHVVFSPDGSLLATASVDSAARLFDVSRGELAFTLRHREPVAHIAFSPDGKRLATSSHDRTARLWDATTGKPLSPPLPHADDVLFSEFSDDGERLVTGGIDGSARVWSAADGRPITPPLPHRDRVHQAAFDAPGRRLATVAGGAVRVWDADTGSPLTPPYLPHVGDVVRVRFAKHTNRLYIALNNGAVVSWTFERPDLIPRELPDYLHAIAGRHIDPTGGLSPLPGSEVHRLWSLHPDKARPTPRDWHTHEADACQAARHWPTALWHLDRLIAVSPNEPAPYFRRAAIHLRQGNYPAAASDYAAAFAR